MDRSLNVATPPTAGAVTVPASVPPPGLVPRVSVTLTALLTRLPPRSSTETWRAGESVAPAVALPGGWTMKDIRLGGPIRTLKGTVVIGANPGALARRT